MSFFNNISNIGNMMQQAKEFQGKFAQLQKELQDVRITAVAGAGLVSIKMNGKGEALEVEIDDSLFNEDRSVLKGLIAGAINDGVRKRQEIKDKKSKDLMSGLKLPEGFNFPFMQED
jgi:DNA-binding YbaB/EbfC family protein